MTSASASDVSAFLAAGGRIVKVQETILVTTQDVLDYLQSCGITAKYSKSNPQVYWWKRKRMSLSQLVTVANSQRRSQQLPPFAIHF